jgi:hypothetical protein
LKAFLIIAAVLAALFLLMLVRVRVYVAWRGTLEAQLRVLFFHFRLAAPETGKLKKEAKPAGKKAEKPVPAKGADVRLFLENFTEIARIGKKLAAGTFRRMTVDRLLVRLTVRTPDAAHTAVLYGQACAVIFPAAAFFRSAVRIRKSEVSVRPDFTPCEEDASEAEFECLAGVRVGGLLLAALGSAAGVLRLLLKMARGRGGPAPAAARKRTAD